jgi:chemotaxis signal transduction protein
MSESVAPGNNAVLLVTIGGGRYGLPLAQVQRVLPMASVLRLPGQPSGTLGVLNLRGDVLRVIDPRPRLGLTTPACTPDQRLIVLAAGSQRFLVWVDAVEDVAEHPTDALSPLDAHEPNRLTTHVLRRSSGELVPVLSAVALQESGTGR